jgi:hypothetical protein
VVLEIATATAASTTNWHNDSAHDPLPCGNVAYVDSRTTVFFRQGVALIATTPSVMAAVFGLLGA